MSDATDEPIVDAETVEPPLRVMSLHALNYCNRLFYLEEVEEIRVADDRIYAGRRLHEEISPERDHQTSRPSDDEELSPLRVFELASEAWGLEGKLDAARRRDGQWVVYEHKRGRCRRARGQSGPNAKKRSKGEPQAWPSDRLQAIAYAVLLQEELSRGGKTVSVAEARIRYHQDNVTVRVTVNEAARDELRAAIELARQLRRSDNRPPVTENERLCVKCSLKIVCLPEEERLAVAADGDQSAATQRLFPSARDKKTLHVATDGSRLERSGRSLVVRPPQSADSVEVRRVPIEQLDAVILHGHVQISTQALHMCRYEEVAVQWMTSGGRVVGTLTPPGRVRQRIRQFRALTDANTCLRLARALVNEKIELQLHYLLRGTRGDDNARKSAEEAIGRIRKCLKQTQSSESIDSLRGLEGMAAKNYFAGLNALLNDRVPLELRFQGRTKRPPKDRFSALLSYGYALVYATVERSIVAVGLEPAFGFFHQPRTAAPPLVLDLMEPFRTLLWEMPLIGSLNRGQWDAGTDFEHRGGHIWLSEDGRRKAIALFESRLGDSHKHPHTGDSLQYARIVELEVRLLEKEWTATPALFGQLRIR